MHFTDFWAIVERDHEIQNPSSIAKRALLAEYCAIRDGLRVLDVGCGKGGLLRAWAQSWEISGTGLEINQHFVATARQQTQAAGVADRISFVEGPALDFRPEPGSYDVVLCIGATFALGDFDTAVPWMRRALKPDGVLAVGEVFANELPLPAASGENHWRDLAGTVAALQSHNLDLIGLIASTTDDWDHYISQQWRSAHTWAAANPDHPDRTEVMQVIDQSRADYVAWQRRYLGWAMFIAAPTRQ